MLQRIKSEFREFKDGMPGRRFVDHYERSRKREGVHSSWRTWAYVGAGSVLLICGLAISLPPVGIPGFLIWIPGLALIASRSRRLSILLDRLEAGARQAWRRVRPRRLRTG